MEIIIPSFIVYTVTPLFGLCLNSKPKAKWHQHCIVKYFCIYRKLNLHCNIPHTHCMSISVPNTVQRSCACHWHLKSVCQKVQEKQLQEHRSTPLIVRSGTMPSRRNKVSKLSIPWVYQRSYTIKSYECMRASCSASDSPSPNLLVRAKKLSACSVCQPFWQETPPPPSAEVGVLREDRTYRCWCSTTKAVPTSAHDHDFVAYSSLFWLTVQEQVKKQKQIKPNTFTAGAQPHWRDWII